MKKTILAAAILGIAAMQAGAYNFNGTEVNSIVLKGSVVQPGTILEYAGDGVWRSTVALTRITYNEYIDRNFYFAVNGEDSKAIRRVASTNEVRLDTGQGGLENIRINNGTYDITLDLEKMTYLIESETDPYRVSVFGSSVANGTGANSMQGYAYLYGKQLEEWYAGGLSSNPLHISGVSIGGNTTTALKNRYIDVLHDFGKYVIIGLSMGNEGLHGSANKQATFNGFRDNMLSLISSLRKDGKVPVVMNNYTHSDYNAEDYGYIKRINLLIHEWDVPSFNTLGAIDDGAGHWASNYVADAGHPNTSGHQEFFYSMVPSLFDALIEGKPLPVRDSGKSLALAKGETLEIVPEGTLHSFTVLLRCKAGNPGRLIGFGQGSGRSQSTVSLTVDGDGCIAYAHSATQQPEATDAYVLDGEWHDVALSYYYAWGMTKVYVDGKEVLARKENTKLNYPIVIGDDEKNPGLEICETALWRAGMNPEEMQAFHAGAMLKSSLEIYSPMTLQDESIPNLAQSTNSIRYHRAPADGDTEDAGVAAIEGENADGKFYNLSGFQVAEPTPGHIYVRHSGNGATKIIY